MHGVRWHGHRPSGPRGDRTARRFGDTSGGAREAWARAEASAASTAAAGPTRQQLSASSEAVPTLALPTRLGSSESLECDGHQDHRALISKTVTRRNGLSRVRTPAGTRLSRADRAPAGSANRSAVGECSDEAENFISIVRGGVPVRVRVRVFDGRRTSPATRHVGVGPGTLVHGVKILLYAVGVAVLVGLVAVWPRRARAHRVGCSDLQRKRASRRTGRRARPVFRPNAGAIVRRSFKRPR